MNRLILLVVFLAGACTNAAPGTTAAAPTGTAVADPMEAPTAAPAIPAATAAATSASQAFIGVVAACKAPATPTTASTEGPFFKAGSPEKPSLVPTGMTGTRIVLIGQVLTRSCTPVVGAKLDFWQADANGSYDNAGFTLRGYVRTDANGQYRIETIVPGRYPGRTPHVHVKVEPPGGRVLTTQLYLPNESGNTADGIFRPELLLLIRQGPPITGAFIFIVDLP